MLASSVTISAPSRVHLGLLQLSRDYPVLNMGFGFALHRPRWLVHATSGKRNRIVTASASGGLPDELHDSAQSMVDRIQQQTDWPSVEITILESIPMHVGLGSKTALLCAVLAAHAAVAGQPTSWSHLRSLTLRGGTSGVGLNTALTGGLVLDAGHLESRTSRLARPSRSRAGRQPPAIAGRWKLRHWPVILATLEGLSPISAQAEIDVFDRFTPISRDETDRLASIVLFGLVPSVVAAAYDEFIEAVSAMQEVGFKQREWSVQDRRVHELRECALELGADCVALSSMGPTLVLFSRRPEELHARLRAFEATSLRLVLTRPRNKGIEIRGQARPSDQDRPKRANA